VALDLHLSPQPPPPVVAYKTESVGYADVPHAVTTPDDSAWPLGTGSFEEFGPGLADVPEEEESLFPTTNSRRTLRQSKSVPELDERRRSLSAVGRAAESQEESQEKQQQQTDRPVSVASDTLGAAFSETPNCNHDAHEPAKRNSVSVRAEEGC